MCERVRMKYNFAVSPVNTKGLIFVKLRKLNLIGLNTVLMCLLKVMFESKVKPRCLKWENISNSGPFKNTLDSLIFISRLLHTLFSAFEIHDETIITYFQGNKAQGHQCSSHVQGWWRHRHTFLHKLRTFQSLGAHLGILWPIRNPTLSEITCLRRLRISSSPEVCGLPVSCLMSHTFLKWVKIWKSSSGVHGLRQIDDPQVSRVTHCSLFINHDPNRRIDPVEKIQVAPSIFEEESAQRSGATSAWWGGSVKLLLTALSSSPQAASAHIRKTTGVVT